MPPKKKARKVRHVDEVTAPEHGHRQRHEHERSVTPNGGEIDEVADRIYARIARAVQGGKRRREGCLFGEFHKQNPPTFDGGPDPMAAENWLLKMEKLLRAFKCTDAQKVLYATYALQGSTNRWWSSTEPLLSTELGEDTPITWEKFKEVFNRTYFPDVVRDRNAREFSDLVQGAMTVEEYVAKFVELSRFAPYLIPDESKKVKKFWEGLNDRICPLIIASRVDTFTEVVKRAMSLEKDFKYNPNSKDSEKKQGPFNSQHGKGQGHKKGFFKNSGNRGQSSRHSKSAYPWSGDKKSGSRCGKLHDGQNCDGVKICFTCKQPRHFARDCPSSKGSGSSSSSQVAKGNDNGKKVQGRVYSLTTQDAQATDTMVAGILALFSAHAKVLFYPSSTHSFVSYAFAKNHDKSPELLDFELSISTPVSDTLLINLVLKSCIICIEGRELLVDLVLLDMHDFDVILGMDWLASYHVSVHCFKKGWCLGLQVNQNFYLRLHVCVLCLV